MFHWYSRHSATCDASLGDILTDPNPDDYLMIQTQMNALGFMGTVAILPRPSGCFKCGEEHFLLSSGCFKCGEEHFLLVS